MNILGIRRSPCFSPNSIDRDAAIFSAVTSQVERYGHEVSIIGEDLFIGVDLNDYDLVFSMARSHRVLKDLALAEKNENLLVINSAQKLLYATRSHIVQSFNQHQIPQPQSFIFDLDTAKLSQIQDKLHFPFWIKRGKECAQEINDICFINDEKDWNQSIHHFKAKNVHQLIAVQHIKGDLIKFYGVEGTSFFSYLYPTDGVGFSKFGLECHNGSPHHYNFDTTLLETIANKAAALIGFTIYGGDAIVKSDGTFYIIDFNDWPSFFSCRKTAAKAIAQRISKLNIHSHVR